MIAPFSFLNHTTRATTEKVVVVVGEDFAARSIDGGVTWTQSVMPSGDWQKVCALANGVFMVVGNGGIAATSIDRGLTFVDHSSSMPSGNWVDVTNHDRSSGSVIAVRSNSGRQYATIFVSPYPFGTVNASTSNMPAIPTTSAFSATANSRGLSRGQGGNRLVAAHIRMTRAFGTAAGSISSGLACQGEQANLNIGVTLNVPLGGASADADARHAAVSQRIGGDLNDSDCLVCLRNGSGSSNNVSGRVRYSTNNGASWSGVGPTGRNYDRVSMARGQVDGRLKAFVITSDNTNFLKLTKADHVTSWFAEDMTHPQNSTWSDIIHLDFKDNVDDTDFLAVSSNGTNRLAYYDKVLDSWQLRPNPLLDSNILRGLAYMEFQPEA